MRKLIILLLVIVVARLLPAQTTLDTAVNFSAKDLNGQTHGLFNILNSGKLVLIDFFSTSCGPCATYAPQIQQSYEHFGQNAGNVHFMGISWGDSNISVYQFDSVYGITYPSVSGLQGSGNLINIAYNILSYPTVILIMPDKTIREKHIWPPTTSRIDSILIANGGITTGLVPAASSVTVLNLYPNPGSGNSSLSLSLSEPTNIGLSIIDLMGKVVQASSHDLSAGYHLLPASPYGLSPGIYLMNISANGVPAGAKRLIVN